MLNTELTSKTSSLMLRLKKISKRISIVTNVTNNWKSENTDIFISENLTAVIDARYIASIWV